MIKKLCILFLSALAIGPSMAQYGNSKDVASFMPKKGDWQVNLNMGEERGLAGKPQYGGRTVLQRT